MNVMNENAGIQGVNLSELGLHSPVKIEKEETQKNEFLQLFVAQLKNQNPLEPQNGADFLAQLAQFSTVEGIKNMESSFNKIADTLNSNQALQASSLVGKKVHVRTDAGILMSGQALSGAIDVPVPVGDLALEIRDETGNLIRTFHINGRDKGEMNFIWDGLDENGMAVPSGVYQFIAKATIDGKGTQLDTYIASNVDSVTVNKNGLPPTLNVSGYGKISMNDIKTIS